MGAVVQQLEKPVGPLSIPRAALAIRAAAALLQEADKAGLLQGGHSSSSSTGSKSGATGSTTLSANFLKQLQQSRILQVLPLQFRMLSERLQDVATSASVNVLWDHSSSSSDGTESDTVSGLPFLSPEGQMAAAHLTVAVQSLLEAWHLLTAVEVPGQAAAAAPLVVITPAAAMSVAGCSTTAMRFIGWALYRQEVSSSEEMTGLLADLQAEAEWALLSSFSQLYPALCIDAATDRDDSGSSSGSSNAGHAGLQPLCTAFLHCWAWRLTVLLLPPPPASDTPTGASGSGSSGRVQMSPTDPDLADTSPAVSLLDTFLQQLGCPAEYAAQRANALPGVCPSAALLSQHVDALARFYELWQNNEHIQDAWQQQQLLWLSAQQQAQPQLTQHAALQRLVMVLLKTQNSWWMLAGALLQYVSNLQGQLDTAQYAAYAEPACRGVLLVYQYVQLQQDMMGKLHTGIQRQERKQQWQQRRQQERKRQQQERKRRQQEREQRQQQRGSNADVPSSDDDDYDDEDAMFEDYDRDHHPYHPQDDIKVVAAPSTGVAIPWGM